MTNMQDKNSTTTESKPFQTGLAVSLSASHFIHDLYPAFLAPLLPLLIDKLSLTLAQAGFLAAFMQVPALLNPFIGRLADRVNVRYFVILAPGLTAIPMSLIGLAPSYGILLLMLFVTGVSIACYHVPAPVMVAKVSGDKVGKGMSFFMTGGELARTIGPLVAVSAVAVFGLEGFYPIMVVGILASVWLYLRLHDIPIKIEAGGRQSLRQTWRETRNILLPLTGILVARAFMHGSMVAFLPTFLNLETGNLWLAGIGLAVLEAAGVAGVFTSGNLSDRLGRRRVLLACIFAAPICLALFVISGGFIRFLTLLFLGFSLLSTTPVMLALVQDYAPRSPSAANGFFMLISFVARASTIPLVGLMGDLLGLSGTYLICAGLGLAGLPFVLMLPVDRRASLSGGIQSQGGS